MNQVNWQNIMFTLDEIKAILGEKLYNETVDGIKNGRRLTIGRDWQHDQQVFDDLCCNLGYSPFFR